MKKLYIPTSTFNFNNILSSESISPKAFYERRGFGYSRWLEIPENNIDNVILLYDRPIGFTRPSSDIEDHPLLVEICTDEDFPQVVEGVFYSDHTIYLSPWRTRFIFFSAQDQHVALSLSDSSQETKLVEFYRKRLVVESPTVGNIPKMELNVGLNNEKIEYDYRINKLKGLLYGYYIGASLSSTPEVTRKVNILRELQDIFFSVLSSEDHFLTTVQNERLNILFTGLQKYNPLIVRLLELRMPIQEIEDWIKSGMKYPGIIDVEELIRYLRYSPENNNPAIDWLKEQQDVLQKQVRKVQKRLEPSAEEIIITDCRLSKISNKLLGERLENSLIIAWVNEVLLSRAYNGKISSFKEKISDEVTTKAKEIYKDTWEGSEAKLLLNQMRKYVRGQENMFRWDNLLVSSIVAVIAKGNDWEQLLAFMQSKSISDYRLAFAFYGELNGFANLTRDFTDNLLNVDEKGVDEKKYVADVYKELYGQLLGTDPTLPKDKSVMVDEETSIDEVDFSYEDQINEFLRDCGCSGAKKDISVYMEICVRHRGISADFLSDIKEDPRINSGKGLQKTVQKYLEKKLNPTQGKNRRVKGNSKDKDLTLFPKEELPDLKSLKKLRSSNKKVEKRLNDNWAYTAEGYDCMSDKHIDYFLHLCKKESRGESKSHKELLNLFTDELARRIEKELKEIRNEKKCNHHYRFR